MTTKIDRINGAYSRLRISGLTVDPTPGDIELALMRLEQMMSEYEYSNNMCFDYNFEVDPDPNSLTNVIQPFWGLMDTNLAVKLIPDFGKKEVPPQLLLEANNLYSTASSALASRNVREIQYPRRMAIGSGNTYRYNRFQRFQHPARLPPNECATHEINIGDINDFQESFRAYLRANETIDSFEMEADPGILLLSSTNNDPIIDYQVQGYNLNSSGNWQQIKLEITTNLGRKQTRLISFLVQQLQTVGNSGDDPVIIPGNDGERIVEVTGNYVVDVKDDIVAVTGPAIVTLPSAEDAIKSVTIKSVIGGGVVMLLPDGTDAINGGASTTIAADSALDVFPIENGWLIS